MKRFTAHISDGRKEEKILFQSAYRKNSILNRADCIREMKLLGIATDQWRIVDIEQNMRYF